jgi:hypothetical protein
MAWPSITPTHHNILHEKHKNVADNMQIDNFDVSNRRIYRFKDCNALLYKKLAEASTTVDPDKKDHKLGRLRVLLEGYESYDIYDADGMDIYNYLLENADIERPGLRWGKKRITVLI